MQFWWVNQNQTYEHEVNGGYLWSPKTSANNRVNPFYDFMTKVEVGDVIFSFKDTLISAIGIASSKAYSNPKPKEFGITGENWGDDGWCVNVDYHELIKQIRPKDNMGVISPLLPDKYSPLQENGNGNQGVYLTSVPFELAKVILNLIGKEAELIVTNFSAEEIEENKVLEIEKEIQQHTSLQSTDKTQLSKSRRGQGIFRTNLERIEKSCRLTGLDAKEHLVASHIKPWRDCTNFERLDGYNGLLLSPHIDRLFDKGYISFNDNGDLLISKLTNQDVLKKWRIDSIKNVGSFNDKQKLYLLYHRDNIFKD